MDCTYDEKKCPTCGDQMSQEVEGYNEKCSNCGFVFVHCGSCMEEGAPILSEYWNGDEFVPYLI